MTRAAILDDYQNVVLDLADWTRLQPAVSLTVFNDHLFDEDAIADRLLDFEIVVINRERTPFTRSLFEKLPNLKFLTTNGMRNQSIDLEAAADHGVTVSGTQSLTYPTAELTWGLILGLLRHIPGERNATRLGHWQTTLGVGLRHKVLGIMGLGRLGSIVAKFGLAFEMDVIAWSQNLTADRCAEIGVTLVDKETLLSRADVVTIHLVLSDRTRGIIGAPELSRMKPTAYLVNTSRGPMIDLPALVGALEADSIAGAAIDVFDREPIAADHPLLKLENALVTPHIGYVIEENYRSFLGQIIENIEAWLNGAPIRLLTPAGN
jgi:phosphoglycerate dehydrogenase-like enzyme